MNNPEKILHGFLELSVSGDQLERFLNLCHARAVSLERIRYLSEKNITTRISINDFRKLLPIHRKTRVRIHILKKRGCRFYCSESKNASALQPGSFSVWSCCSGFLATSGISTLMEM